MTKQTEDPVEIAHFVYNHYELGGWSLDELREIVADCLIHQTFVMFRAETKIRSIALFHVVGPLADMFVVVVDPFARHTNELKELARAMKDKFPGLRLILYEREVKYPSRKRKILDIDKFIGSR